MNTLDYPPSSINIVDLRVLEIFPQKSSKYSTPTVQKSQNTQDCPKLLALVKTQNQKSGQTPPGLLCRIFALKRDGEDCKCSNGDVPRVDGEDDPKSLQKSSKNLVL